MWRILFAPGWIVAWVVLMDCAVDATMVMVYMLITVESSLANKDRAFALRLEDSRFLFA